MYTVYTHIHVYIYTYFIYKVYMFMLYLNFFIHKWTISPGARQMNCGKVQVHLLFPSNSRIVKMFLKTCPNVTPAVKLGLVV